MVSKTNKISTIVLILLTLLMLSVISVRADDTQVEPRGTIKIDIYKSSELADKFETKQVTIKGLSAQDVVDALSINEIIPSNVKVNRFEQVGDKINLDVSVEFSNHLKELGTTGEKYTMGSLVNTMLKAYNAKEIKITANGKTIETGHTKYDTYLNYYK